jgi:hypothetical protein
VCQSCRLGAPDGAAHLCAPLGGIRKRAFDITLTPILLVTPGLNRLLMRKSVGSNGNPWQPPGKAPVLHSDCVGALL